MKRYDELRPMHNYSWVNAMFGMSVDIYFCRGGCLVEDSPHTLFIVIKNPEAKQVYDAIINAWFELYTKNQVEAAYKLMDALDNFRKALEETGGTQTQCDYDAERERNRNRD